MHIFDLIPTLLMILECTYNVYTICVYIRSYKVKNKKIEYQSVLLLVDFVLLECNVCTLKERNVAHTFFFFG